MGAIVVRIGNASRQPLQDQVDIHIVSTATDATVSTARDRAGHVPMKFENLIEGQTYLVKVFPKRHRPVAQFVRAGSDQAPGFSQFYAPLHPEHVRAATFPDYDDVQAEMKRVLEASTIDGASGQALYAALGNTQRAGLFNLFAKMSAFAFPDGTTIWSAVERLTDVRGDRIYVDVTPGLKPLVEGAVPSEQFRSAPSKLHEPPDGYDHAGSFKSAERYGNLQLTFFCTVTPPACFRVDADIDDAAGLGHTFQVLRNFVTHGTTHPYDIHQILVFRQDATLPYQLA